MQLWPLFPHAALGGGGCLVDEEDAVPGHIDDARVQLLWADTAAKEGGGVAVNTGWPHQKALWRAWWTHRVVLPWPYSPMTRI